MKVEMFWTFGSIAAIVGITFLFAQNYNKVSYSLDQNEENSRVKGSLHFDFQNPEGIKSKCNDHKTMDNHYKKLKQPSFVIIDIDVAVNVSVVSAFWKSTGFCPPSPHQNDSVWLLKDDMRQNIAFIGGIPFGGIEQVRVHWLLDTVKINGNRLPVFNFTKLDQFLDLLWSNQLRPIFEVMGNPSNYFSDFENKTQVIVWRSLIFEIVQRYIGLYGLNYVSTWNFETWNEPRVGHFDGLNFTIRGFLNYYDATRNALKAAGPNIKLGGPGGECHEYNIQKSYCWNLLNHVVHGKNYLTGQFGQGIDFISIHKKGEEPNNTAIIFKKEQQFYSDLKIHLPELLKIPIYNDEGDPLVGWSKDKWWRADVTYAAMVAKVIVEHQNKWLSKRNNLFNLKLLSNDNGFLSYNPNFFTQRTLLARFQMNNTKPPHVQFIRKPVYAVMGLLSYLGETQLNSTVDIVSPNHIGVLTTYHHSNPILLQDSNQITVFIYSSLDTEKVLSETNVSVNLMHMNTSKDLHYVIYRLDNYWTNPHGEWVTAGKPNTPDFATFVKMRAKEEPLRVQGPTPVPPGPLFHVNITVSLPGVALIHMCDKAISPPDQVTDVQISNITSGQVLIIWSDSCVNTKCIKTYEVEFSQKNGSNLQLHYGSYQRINDKDIIFTTFVFAKNTTDVAVHGNYRIRAVDYWNRPGEYSLIVHYP